ncbi:hypothetical protein ABW21_db0204321 [Orbilia brochopaga]|nr:hypothetical protein ABW21_db0204321 [Drechslerella brochopaga]
MVSRPSRRGAHTDNRGGGGGGSITKSLEKKVDTLVRDYYLQADLKGTLTSTMDVLEYVQAHDASLKRMKRAQVEKFVTKSMAIVEQELGDSGTRRDDSDGGSDSDFDAFNQAVDKDNNSANRRIVEMWSKSSGGPSSNAPVEAANEEPVQPVVDAQTPGRRKRERISRSEPPTKKQKIDRSPPTDISLNDFGGIEQVLKDIKELITTPLTHTALYSCLGVQIPRGILLHGPPGCGKTMLANAIAAVCLQKPPISGQVPFMANSVV